jgi:hypothetical protein
MWTYYFKAQESQSVYKSLREFLDSDCGSTDKPSTVEAPWADSGTPTASGKSEPTQPTKSSSKDVSKYSPAHYQRGKIQVWDFISDQNLDFLTGNVVKYVCRAGLKDYESELDDLLKAKAYIEKKIAQVSEGRNR